MKFLTKEHLNKLNIPRLQNVLKCALKAHDGVLRSAGPRCCELCNEYIGNDWNKDVGVEIEPYIEYFERVKNVLLTKQKQVRTRR